MTAPLPQPPRSHLIDRAVEAMGGLDALSTPRNAPPRDAETGSGAPPAATAENVAEPGIRRGTPALPLTEPAGSVPPQQGIQGQGSFTQTSVSQAQLSQAQPSHGPAGQGAALLEPPGAAVADPSRPLPVTLDTLLAAGLVATPGKGRSRASEEVSVVQHQVLRTVLAGPPADARSRVVLVTSARPGEGKTFLALNIAASLAAGGSHPVVLVDADGKVDSLTQLLGLSERPGLRLLAAEGGRNARSMVVPTALPRLSVLPYGIAPAKGPGIPPGTALAAAVRQASAALPGHVIVLDSPPALSTSDAGTLAGVSGQVLVVVEAERTQRSEVEAALDLVEACPVLQLVLNKARFSESDTFGTYAGAYGGDSK